MARLAIFIDGGYLDKLAQEEFTIHVDYSKIADEILNRISAKSKSIELLRVYYYNCLPYQTNHPTPEESLRFSKKQSFYEILNKLPCFLVRLGRLVLRGYDSNGQPIFQQKKVDLMLGLDIALLSGKRQISHIAIIAGDSDLLPALHVAKDEGVLVWLFHGPRRSRRNGTSTYASELWQEADERFEIDNAFMKSIEYVSKKP